MIEATVAERRADNIKLLTQMEGLRADIGDLKQAMSRMSDTMAKMALVEERQAQGTQAIERAFATIEKQGVRLEGVINRVSELEKHQITNSKTSGWVERAVLGVVVFVAVFIGERLFK